MKRGFTLIEVLLVIAIIAILAGIVIIAVNPSKQLSDANNAQRSSDVTTILNAVYQFSLDQDGDLPATLDGTTGSSQVIGTASSGCDTTCTAVTTVTGCADLSSDLVPNYIVAIPFDPASGGSGNTDYYINRDSDNRITVGSCDPAQSATINVTR